VRRGTETDAERVARINVDGWSVAYRGLMPDYYLDSMRPGDRVDRVRQRLRQPDPHATLLAVGSDGAVGAYVGVTAARDREDRHPSLSTGELAALYADPARFGQGAGKAAHDAGLEYLAGQGFEHAVLWVLEGNAPSRRFYEAHGWICDGATKTDRFGGVVVTEIRYSRAL
jgi:RimJ/RimL family protein N-acetyltransferase